MASRVNLETYDQDSTHNAHRTTCSSLEGWNHMALCSLIIVAIINETENARHLY